MTFPVKVPDIGGTVDTVTVVRWLVEEGEEIIRGQKIVEIETDKAVVELESVAEGVLAKKAASDGDEVAIGAVIAYVGNVGDSVSEIFDAVPDIHSPETTPQSAASREISRPRVSPVVRNLARQKGVDPDRVVGTGKDGMITRWDILAAARHTDANS